MKLSPKVQMLIIVCFSMCDELCYKTYLIVNNKLKLILIERKTLYI